jgi:hypothetical protein
MTRRTFIGVDEQAARPRWRRQRGTPVRRCPDPADGDGERRSMCLVYPGVVGTQGFAGERSALGQWMKLWLHVEHFVVSLATG